MSKSGLSKEKGGVPWFGWSVAMIAAMIVTNIPRISKAIVEHSETHPTKKSVYNFAIRALYTQENQVLGNAEAASGLERNVITLKKELVGKAGEEYFRIKKRIALTSARANELRDERVYDPSVQIDHAYGPLPASQDIPILRMLREQAKPFYDGSLLMHPDGPAPDPYMKIATPVLEPIYKDLPTAREDKGVIKRRFAEGILKVANATEEEGVELDPDTSTIVANTQNERAARPRLSLPGSRGSSVQTAGRTAAVGNLRL